MSLIDRLIAPPIRTQNQFCTIGNLLADLAARDGEEPGGEFAALAGAVSTPGWSAVALSSALSQEGYEVTVRHIREHRSPGHAAEQCAAHTVGRLR
jgi:hypothetical protein